MITSTLQSHARTANVSAGIFCQLQPAHDNEGLFNFVLRFVWKWCWGVFCNDPIEACPQLSTVDAVTIAWHSRCGLSFSKVHILGILRLLQNFIKLDPVLSVPDFPKMPNIEQQARQDVVHNEDSGNALQNDKA